MTSLNLGIQDKPQKATALVSWQGWEVRGVNCTCRFLRPAEPGGLAPVLPAPGPTEPLRPRSTLTRPQQASQPAPTAGEPPGLGKGVLGLGAVGRQRVAGEK